MVVSSAVRQVIFHVNALKVVVEGDHEVGGGGEEGEGEVEEGEEGEVVCRWIIGAKLHLT